MTMDLIKCGSCTAAISPGADKCPKCGARNERKPVETMACRVCGSGLEKAAHRKGSVYYGGVYKGSTQYKWSVVHLPCPHCGEPKPLWRPYDETHDKFMLLGPAVLTALFWIAAEAGFLFHLPHDAGDTPGASIAVVTFLSIFVYGGLVAAFAASIITVQWVRKLSWRE
jgi:ribosomal protein L40E